MEKPKYLDLLAQHGVSCAHPGGFSMTRELLRHETITPEMILLDIGCGTGQTSAYIATHYPCRVVAADINPKMIERAGQTFNKNNLDIPLVRADAMDLPFRKNSFHVVLSESVTAFTAIPKALREYQRVLKPGGILLAIEVTALLPLTQEEMTELKGVTGLNDIPAREEWFKMFQNAGFIDTKLLYQQRMNWGATFSSNLNKAFQDYIAVMFRHRKKIGYGVYRCQKQS